MNDTTTQPPPATTTVPATTVENYVAAIKSYETAARLDLETARQRLGAGRATFASIRTGDPGADMVRRENELYDGAQAIAEFADQIMAGGGGNSVQFHKLCRAATDLALQAIELADLKRTN